MPRTNLDEVYENGVLKSRIQREISDAQIFREDAPLRLRSAIATLNQWAQDEQNIDNAWGTLTNAQKDTANRVLHRRIGIFFDRFGDLLITLALD